MAERVHVRSIGESDEAMLYAVFEPIVESGEGFPQAPPLTRQVFQDTWLKTSTAVVGAFMGDQLVGAYYLKPNFAPRAGHIANAGYIVDRSVRRQGVGRILVEHSIGQAHSDGYTAVMFNLVFESNPARALYEDLGWREIGRIPRAVDGEPAIIYWRDV